MWWIHLIFNQEYEEEILHPCALKRVLFTFDCLFQRILTNDKLTLYAGDIKKDILI